MKIRELGRTGIRVGEIGLGMWAIGGDVWGEPDDAESLRVIDAALDSGVNFFDTADVYGGGHSEEVLARAMKGRRGRFVVATKIGWIGFDADRNRTAYDTVEKLVAGVESNLKRLRTDRIEVIQSHIPFREPTMEIFLEGFRKLKAEGKVLGFGVSTGDFEYLKAFNSGMDCSTLQVDYSLLNRTAEKELLPYCAENRIGVIVRGALAMGILTGKFSPASEFKDDDFRRKWKEDPEQKAVFIRDMASVEKLRKIAGSEALAKFSLRFALSNPAVSVVIPGARTLGQLESNLGAAGGDGLSPAEMERVGAVIPPGGGRKIWPA